MQGNDPRAERTRAAILGAFTELLFSRRYDAIRTADLIAAAGIGRSTFYEHFRGKDDVLVAATEPVLQTLAAAALDRASPAQLRAMLDHVWRQRGFARRLLEGRTGRMLEARLAAMIAARLEPGAPAALRSAAVAAALWTMLRLWLAGTVACPAAELALHLKACACLRAAPVTA
ncbi:AcrR family transcriptional regulator [Sphingomonas naasensis]|uniref:TetR/AcrR family transcriptional regulator n=1 Tax=Sphingomonas naasensis TaxID=1344951 RepID=A0A4S1W8P5_9SPHN|nr:TetR/AcrR family transcriptional regulator [Sphingomonas naasensis]NIJ21379.1 AcrR family transcriptional regulator [Sphingomonas naasensis]TGX38803.1 TetR/AcrR family transcriptional regulator [Sphingomonas naasensis]